MTNRLVAPSDHADGCDFSLAPDAAGARCWLITQVRLVAIVRRPKTRAACIKQNTTWGGSDTYFSSGGGCVPGGRSPLWSLWLMVDLASFAEATQATF